MESGLCFQITAGTVTAPRWVQGSKNVHSLRGLRSELWLTGQTTCLIFISCVSRVPIWWMRLSVNSLGEAPSGRHLEHTPVSVGKDSAVGLQGPPGSLPAPVVMEASIWHCGHLLVLAPQTE